MATVIEPCWPAPTGVRALSTTRIGGTSTGKFSTLNMGFGSDCTASVVANREAVAQIGGFARPAFWLQQVHGNHCVDADATAPAPLADASFSRQPGTVCVVMTADCLPVLFCDRAGSRVAAAHAGWRGLSAGVLEATVAALGVAPGELMAWLGPAIGADVYEVGPEVRAAFVGHAAADASAFRANRPGHWLADLYALARARLVRLGLTQVSGGEYCTYSDARRFYSYRRDRSTGRMASFVWIATHSDDGS